MTDRPDYGQRPTASGFEPDVPTGPPPPSVANAVKLMLARAALSVVGLLTLFVTQASLREQIAGADPDLSGGDLDTAMTAALVVGTVFGLVFLALYLWLATQVRRGKNWARITTLVLSGLSAVSGLATLGQPAPALTRIVGVLALVLDVAVFVLLVSPRSAEYCRRRR